MCHFFIIQRLKQIENRPDFDRSYEKAMKNNQKKDILNNIVKYLEVILSELTDFIRDQNKNKKLFIRLYCSTSIKKLKYNARHQLISDNTESMRKLKDARRVFIFEFFLLMLYEGIVYDIEHICRYLFYLLKHYFNDSNDISNKIFHIVLSDIIQMLRIPIWWCNILITRKIRSSAIGALQIIFTENGSTEKYDEMVILRQLLPFRLDTDIIEIENSVTNIHIVESNAAAKILLQQSQTKDAIFKHKRLLLIESSGVPDIAVRLFLNHVSEKYPNIAFTSEMDCDQFGFRFHKMLQMGSVTNAFLNTL